MIVRDQSAPMGARMLRGVIGEFTADVLPRLERLHEAYTGQGAITRRTRSPGLPNNKLVHAYPRYIVTMASGYLVGAPVKYTDDTQADALKALEAIHRGSGIDSVDAELAADASIYGRGVCVCYTDERGAVKAATLNPREAFVVYDDTVEHRPLFGVHWMQRRDEAGKVIGVTAHVHTESEVQTYEGKELSALRAVSAKAHLFGGVPMVEFWNNAQEMGDFEPVLSLIEAYDVLESDRVNDKQQFTDAVLLLTGCTLAQEEPIEGEAQDTRSAAQRLLEEKTLSLPDENAKAEWLVKASDESGAEMLRNAIKAEIHKMSMIPDLTDEHFAANASGVAMRYKLFGLEQLTVNKERWFGEGLRTRLRLFAAMMHVLAKGELDAERVEISFTRSLPVNETELAAMVAQLNGLVPHRTLLSRLPFVEDVDKAMDELDAERREAAQRQAEAFGGQYRDEEGEADEAGGAQEDDVP